MSYYDGTKLLSMKDINGDTPEIYICTTNRTGGKTTYFNRLMINRYLNKHEKFCLLYRFKYELDDIPNKFFKDIQSLFFPEYDMTALSRGSGNYIELFLNEKSCGYAVSLNGADAIKKYSHAFSDVANMLFDEFQSETNNYCADEVKKLMSIHTSIARGQGKQVRYVPIYMLSNPVSIVNPYYVELGITNRLDNKTKFLRGEGFVMEQGFIESASKAQKDSAFNRAFANNKYLAYSAESVYLNDNLAFIEKISGRNKYLCTIKYNGIEYALREYPDSGIIYCDYSVDQSFRFRLVVSTEDFNENNYVMIKRNHLFILTMQEFFQHGCFRFKDVRCKEAVLSVLNYIH